MSTYCNSFWRRFLVSAMLLGLVAGCSDGEECVSQPRNYAEWLALAKTGDAVAQYNVGVMLLSGEVVEKDERGAVEWLTRAAMGGDADAKFNLGALNASGRIVPRDDGMALRWYRDAAQSGHPEANHNLGYAYYRGRGVARDVKNAVKFFEIAALHGDLLLCRGGSREECREGGWLVSEVGRTGV